MVIFYKGEDIIIHFNSDTDISTYTKVVKFFTPFSAIKTATVNEIDDNNFTAIISDTQSSDLKTGTLNIVVEFSLAGNTLISKSVECQLNDAYQNGGAREGVGNSEFSLSFNETTLQISFETANYGTILEVTQARDEAIQAKEDAQAILETIDNLDSIGILNASTGVATIESGNVTLTAIPPTGWISGQSVTVQTTGNISFAGVNFTNGTTLQIGDELRKRNTQWELLRFAIGTGTITEPKISKDAQIIKNWEVRAYLQNAQVLYTDGVMYYANANTLSTDIPSVSSKWSIVLSNYNSRININESNFDALQRRVLGEYVEKPILGTTTRWDFANTLQSAGNIASIVGLDRLVSWTGQTDSSDNSFVSYKDAGILATGRTGNTIVFSATIGTIRTTSPFFGIGWDNGTDKVSILLRSTGQISAYIKGAGFTDYQTATTAQAFVVGDIVTIEVQITSTGVTFRCAKNNVFSPYYSFAKVIQGNFYIVNRGSLDFTLGKFLYKTYSEIQATIDSTLVSAKSYSDTKDAIIQSQVTNITVPSVNLLPPVFSSGTYYKVGTGGDVITGTGWIRSTNKITVLPNTQYTICGVDTQFVGNEYDSTGASIRNIAPNVDPPGARYSFVTFTTSPTTTQLGLNITSNGGTDCTGTAMLVLGSTIPSSYQAYGDTYVNGQKVKGDIAGYTKTADLQTIFPNVFYSVNTTGYSGRLLIYVYVKYSVLSKYYIRYQIGNDYDLSARKDLYRIVGADLYKFDGTNMVSQSKQLLTNGESEFVFHQSGKTDFTGGFHGDEKQTDIKFFVNGLVLSVSSNISLTSANEFSYIQKSSMYETDNATDTIIATHHKRTVFSLGGYKTENRLIGVATSILLDITYFGIACITREQSEVFYDENYNYITANSDNAEKLNDTGAREVDYYSTTNKLGAKVTSEITKPNTYDADAVMIVWDALSSNYRKYYRRLINKTLTAGTIWEGNCTIKHTEFI